MSSEPKSVEELLAAAACDSLENLAFTELEPAPEGEFAGGGGYRGARIRLGTLGRLDLALEAPLLREVASTLYSLEAESLDDAVLDDAVQEILNIIAGRFLAGMPRGNAGNTLGLPVLHPETGDWRACPVKRLFRAAEGGHLALGFLPETVR